MIIADQPDCFPADLQVAVSSKSDGTMLNRTLGTHDYSTLFNRKRWLSTLGTSYDHTVYQKIVYEPTCSYEEIAEVDSSSVSKITSGVVADALFTKENKVGLFLPVADCVATVIYDPAEKFLAMAHFGRHSTLSNLLPNLLSYFARNGSDMKNLIVWMSPSAQKKSYRLDYFKYETKDDWRDFYDKKSDGYYLDLSGYNRQKLIESGIQPSNVFVSEVDTVTNDNYFSHLAGETSGRVAVFAMMR